MARNATRRANRGRMVLDEGEIDELGSGSYWTRTLGCHLIDLPRRPPPVHHPVANTLMRTRSPARRRLHSRRATASCLGAARVGCAPAPPRGRRQLHRSLGQRLRRFLPVRQRRLAQAPTRFRRRTPSSGVTRDMSDRNQLVVRSVLDDAMARRARFPPRAPSASSAPSTRPAWIRRPSERAGASPLAPTLSDIDAITQRSSLLGEIAQAADRGTATSRSALGPTSIRTTPLTTSARFDRGGLGLPDRDYYLKTDPSTDSLRTAYVAHIASVLTLGGERHDSAARRRRPHSRRSRPQMAKASLDRVARRDPAATDHPMTLAQLRAADAGDRLGGLLSRRRACGAAQRSSTSRPGLFQAAQRADDSHADRRLARLSPLSRARRRCRPG